MEATEGYGYVRRPEEFSWRDVDIPGGNIPVSLARLAIERDTLVSQSLVRFPPGWERRESGWYSVDEEFFILEGALHMSGSTYQTGDYAVVPAGYLRFASTTPDGCLLLAWFSGKAEWTVGVRHGPRYADRLVQATWETLPDQRGPAGTGRLLRREGNLSTWILTGELAIEAPTATDLFSIPDLTWAQTPAGDILPVMSSPVFARLHTP